MECRPSAGVVLSVFLACSCHQSKASTVGPSTGSEAPTGSANRPGVAVTLDLPSQPYNYARPELPPFYFQNNIVNTDNTPVDNPTTDHGATLGRVLFYDKVLSQNRSVACASCHQIGQGLSDELALSKGFLGGLTGRHSMGLTNARYYRSGRFFWDERAQSLEAQVLMPIQDPVEMGLTLEDLLARVGGESYYPALFGAAFGDTSITNERIARALAQFVRGMVSYRSRYDEGRAQVATTSERFPNFNDEENLGKQLFFDQGRTGCSSCHAGDAFVAPGPRNNGLDAVTTDAGVGRITGNARDSGRFKSPSLRNVGLHSPYMHDGRFTTLEQVIEHYNSGVQNHPNLDGPLRRNGQARRLNLTEAEKNALVALLQTLSDHELAGDPKFANPFRVAE